MLGLALALETKACLGVSAPFNPLSVSPSLLYDASDLASLFQNSNGTGAVSADSDPVGYLGDLSGSGKHFLQATAASRPVLDITSGKYSVQFDGSDDWYNNGANPILSDFTTGSTFEVVLSGKFNTVATDNADYTINDPILASGGGYFSVGARSSGKLGATAFDAGGRTAEDDYTIGQPFVLNIYATGGVMTLQVNSRTAVTVNLAGNGAIDNVTNTMFLGGDGVNKSDVNFHCMLVKKDAVLSASDRLGARQWAAGKAGVTL